MAARLSGIRTRRMTLYRLGGLEASQDGMEKAINFDSLGPNDSLDYVTVADAPAAWVIHDEPVQRAGWCDDAETTIGRPINVEDKQAWALLVVAVDGVLYAVGYGHGHHLLRRDVRDADFGLSVAIRVLDPENIDEVTRRTLSQQARTDVTYVPSGMPLWQYGLDWQLELVKRTRGKVSGQFQVTSNSKVTMGGALLEGANGLLLNLAVEPERFVADIREVERALRTGFVRPEFRFIDQMRPVRSNGVLDDLNGHLDALIGSPEGESKMGRIAVGAPTDLMSIVPNARTYKVKIGSTPITVDVVNSETLLGRARLIRQGERVEALRKGSVVMLSNDGREIGETTSPAHWFEVAVDMDEHHYFFVEGQWYRLGPQYVDQLRDEVNEIFEREVTVELPPWETGWCEARYNREAHEPGKGYYRLDREFISTPWHKNVEICDILGPHFELIHVKRAKRSEPLSHLFNQGVVAARTLLAEDDARARFQERLARSTSAGPLPIPYSPQIIYAILLSSGKKLTPETLFPFAQIALVQADRMLRRMGCRVSVVGVESAEPKVGVVELCARHYRRSGRANSLCSCPRAAESAVVG